MAIIVARIEVVEKLALEKIVLAGRRSGYKTDGAIIMRLTIRGFHANHAVRVATANISAMAVASKNINSTSLGHQNTEFIRYARAGAASAASQSQLALPLTRFPSVLVGITNRDGALAP